MDRYIATALERLLARCPLHRAGNGRRAAHATATRGGDVGLLASGPGIGDARSVTRVRAAIALVLVGGVLAAVPGSADARSPSRSYLKGPFTTATVNRFTGDLARAGVGVYEPGATRPVRRVRGRPSPLRVSATQLRSLAAGAWARTGLSGKSLNAVSGSVRLSRRLKMSAAVLVAGWAKRAHTPKARLARRIMGRVDWRRYRQLVFPNAVLVLQAADTASHLRDAGLARGRAAALAGAAAAPLLAPFQAAPVGPCTATLNFVRGTVNKFFDVLGEALSAKTLKRLLGNNWFSDVVSGVVELLVFKPVRAVLEGARKVVLAAIELPIKVVTTAISGISSAVGVAGTVANALTPWTGKVTAAPDPVTLGTKPQEGLFDLRVTAPGGEFQWPDWMTDCAQVVGLTLPTLTPKGAKVTWDVGSQTPAGVISRVLDSGPLSDLGAASLTWVTATETPEQAKGHLRVGGVLAVARVQRDDLDKLVKLVHDRILGLLPDIVVKYFGPTIRRVTEPLIERLAEGIETLRTVEANTLLRVRYHVAKDKDKKPGGPGGRPPASCGSRPSGSAYLVVPGESIGGVRLGATRACVLGLRPLGLARPTQSTSGPPAGTIYDNYRTGSAQLLVGYRDDRVFIVSAGLGPWRGGGLAYGVSPATAAEQTGCQGYGHNSDGSRSYDEPEDYTQCEKSYGPNTWLYLTFNAGDSGDVPPSLAGFTLTTQQIP